MRKSLKVLTIEKKNNQNLLYFNIPSRIASELLTVRDNPIATHWNADEGYRTNANESEVYPYRVFGTSALSALGVELNIFLDTTFKICKFFTPGFIISFQMAEDVLSSFAEVKIIPVDQRALIRIKPKVTVTSGDLHHYSPQVRGCYFRSERRLRFYKSYSQRKCEEECYANSTRKICGCVQFYMPST